MEKLTKNKNAIDLGHRVILENEFNRKLYQMGVSLRNVFDELDYTYKVLLNLYKYYYSEIRPYVVGKDGSIDWQKARKELMFYLSKIKKYDVDIAKDMVQIVCNYSLLEVDFEIYKNLLYEIKESYKMELLQQVEPSVRRNIYFVEGFGKNPDDLLRDMLIKQKGNKELQDSLRKLGGLNEEENIEEKEEY